MIDGIRIRYVDGDGFTMFYIPSREFRKHYTNCPLCGAILNEEVISINDYCVRVYNKYPVIDDSSLLLSKKHVAIFNKEYLKSLYKIIIHDNLIGLYDDPFSMSVPGHLHVELIDRNYFNPKFSNLTKTSIRVYMDYLMPLLAISPDDFDLFLLVYEKLKNLNYKFNIIFTAEKTLFHLLSSTFVDKKIGARECIKIFSTSREDIFEKYRQQMFETLIAGSLSEDVYLELIQKIKKS